MNQEGRVGRPTRKDKLILPDYSEGIQIKTEDEDPRFNNALARGLAILRAFELDEPMMGNLEIAEATGLPKSTVSRLSFTLTQLGYLRYREKLGKYELAAGVVALAYPYIAGMALPAIARPSMEALAKATRTNVGLGVQEGLSMLYLEYALGQATPNRLQRVGFRVPLVRTAMGRACIAGMSGQRRVSLYEDLREHYHKEWPALYDQLEDAASQVNAHGYCIAANTFRRGTVSVAVPYVESDGRTLLAFNSQGAEPTQSPAMLAVNGRKLVDMVTEIRRRAAGEPPARSPGRPR